MKKLSIILIALLCIVLAACGHKHTWQASTCTSPKLCTSCGETEGEALGHNFSEWETSKAATCTEAGTETRTCSVCGETVDQEVPMKDHTPGDWITTYPATPINEGTRIRRCTICNEKLSYESYELSKSEIWEYCTKHCIPLRYESLARYPDFNEYQYVRFSGYVVQICSEASSPMQYSTYRVATSGRYDDVIYIKVDNYGSFSRILEDDYITVYGMFEGLKTYETVLGASVTIPCVIVAYIE